MLMYFRRVEAILRLVPTVLLERVQDGVAFPEDPIQQQ